MLFQQDVADPLALLGITHHHRNDVAVVPEVGNTQRVEPLPQLRHPVALPHPLHLAGLEMADRGGSTGGHRRGKRWCEDEAGGKAPHEIDQCRRTGDVASDHAKGLAQRALDDGQAIHQPLALGDAAAARPVHAHRMHLVEIGHGAILVGEIADLLDRPDVAVHRIDGLEGDELGPRGIGGLELGLQVGEVVVAEDVALGTAVADALDHRGVVAGIREHDAAGNAGGERAKCRPVRDIAGGEEEGRLLAVEVGQLALQFHVIVVGAGDVAGAARTGAAGIQRLVHGGDDLRVLAHAEIVVGAPDGDLGDARGPMMGSPGKAPGPAFEIGKHPVAALFAQLVQFRPEKMLVGHGVLRFAPYRVMIRGGCVPETRWWET